MRSLLGTGRGRVVLVLLFAIVVTGVALRIDAALRPVDPNPDSAMNLAIAKALYEDGSWGSSNLPRDPNEMSPGAPLFYAAVYFVTGGVDPTRAALAVAVLGGFTIAFVFMLTLALSDRLPARLPRDIAGLLAATGTALCPTFIDMDSRFFSESIAGVTLTAGLLSMVWASRGGRLVRWSVPGFFMGATILVRPEYLLPAALMAVFVAVAVALRVRRSGTRRPLAAFGRPAAAVGIFIAAVAVFVLPWTVRNYVVLDRFVAISTGGGRVLYTGTHLAAGGKTYRVKEILMETYPELRSPARRGKPITRRERARTNIYPYLEKVAAKHPGMPLDEALSKIARENISQYMETDPVSFVRMLGTKAWAMWREGYLLRSDRATWQPLHLALCALAIVGFLVLLFMRPWAALLMLSVIGSVSFSMVFGDSVPRRQAPLMPLVIALAGVACAAGLSVFTRRSGVHGIGRL